MKERVGQSHVWRHLLDQKQGGTLVLQEVWRKRRAMRMTEKRKNIQRYFKVEVYFLVCCNDYCVKQNFVNNLETLTLLCKEL